jgi:transposase-like protein
MMKKSTKTVQDQEAIVAEYLTGELSFRKLGEKHGVDFRVIHYWVSRFQGKNVTKKKSKEKKHSEQNPQDNLPTDVKQLQEELRKAKLHNKLLNAMIDIAEDQLKIDIRKKSGTKQ